jgi:hypothetical protein
MDRDVKEYLEQMLKAMTEYVDDHTFSLNDLLHAGFDKSVPLFIRNHQKPSEIARHFLNSLEEQTT